MRTAVSYGLMALWILWALPFLLRRTHSRGGRRRAKTAPIALLGVILQAAAYPIVWSNRYFLTHPLELLRLVSSLALGIVALLLIWSALPALGKQWRMQAGVYEDHVLVRTGAYRFLIPSTHRCWPCC